MSNRLRVYLAEDNADDRAMVSECLLALGPDYELSHFLTGDELCDQVAEDRRRRSLPLLILLDLNLPGLDGLAVLDYLKGSDELRSIPVVMLTTSNNPDDIRGCYRAGANCYTVKPFELPEFRSLLQETLEYWLVRATLPDDRIR